MISPSNQEALQQKIDAVIEQAKDDPALKAQVDDALATAQRAHDEQLASDIITGGLVLAQYLEFVARGLLAHE